MRRVSEAAFKIAKVLLLMAGVMPAILFAETADKDGFDLLRGFSREIYVMAEKNGGSVEQWDLAEAELISAFERLQKRGRWISPNGTAKGAPC